MRLLILSDLHLELWRQFAPRIGPFTSPPDVVILAGDISSNANGVQWASQNFPGISVLYVLGNHEAYGQNLEQTQEDIANACRASGNVNFLNCDERRIGNVRFLGATLWTDFNLFGEAKRQKAISSSDAAMADYKRIRVGIQKDRMLRAEDTIRFHETQKLWLSQKLAEPFEGKTVVITHMAPSMRSVSEQFASDLVSAAYASNLDELASQADMWVHGHVHDSFDYRIGECRVICNPCGYMTRGGGIENQRFDSNFIVEISTSKSN